MLVLDVVVPGEPVGKGRPIFSRATGTARTPDKTVAWEEKARQHMAARWSHAPLPRDVPVTVEIECVVERPQRLLKKSSPPARLPCHAKPDGDNAEKAVWDALVLAGVLEDDVAVWKWGGSKEYAAIGELPHVRVCVYSDTAPLPKVPVKVPSWADKGTCETLTGAYEKDDPERGLILVSMRHTCQRVACEARRWRIVRLPEARRPVDGVLVAFGPGEVVR